MVVINKYEAAKVLRKILQEYPVYVKSLGVCSQILPSEVEIDTDGDIVVNDYIKTKGVRNNGHYQKP